MMPMDQYTDAYRLEAAELLAELEATLLDLEDSPQDPDLVAKAFRAMHTIKGSGAMFGFDEIASFTHELETVFEKVRSGEVAVTGELVGLALEAKDVIRALLDGSGQDVAAETERLTAALRQHLPDAGPVEVSAAAENPPEPAETRGADAAAPRAYRVRFRPNAGLLQDGTNPLGLLEELRSLGPCQVVAHTSAIPPVEACDPEACYLSWDAILVTDRGEDAVRDVFLFVDDRSDVRIDVVDDGRSLDSSYKRLGEILLERGDLSPEDLQGALSAQKRIGDLLEEKGLATPEAVRAAAVEQQVVREARARRESAAAQTESAQSIRVAAEKLDGLVDLVGELVIAQARLAQVAGDLAHPALSSIAEEIERLSAELRDNTLNIRMLPIGTTFGKFKRLVRDLSAELGKEIDLVTEGAETELDKTVIERLGDPLVHLIRNSCDHGIEPPAAREAAGKPRRGTVRLSAYHSGPNVFVEIRDDGAGLDPAVIRAKAEEKGLVAAGASLTDREVFCLVFLPGFSTARQVSSVSGRGVGMDVVKRAIDTLRGSVELDSERGVGTTVRIKLPLTLAIIEGLLVGVGGESYVLPLSLVEECVELGQEEAERANGRRLAAVRGELVPYFRLREWFSAGGDRPAIEQIVVANVEGERFGFVVDEVIGQHQTVIKALGKMYRSVDELSGATILGDGSVALILDVPKLVASAVAGR